MTEYWVTVCISMHDAYNIILDIRRYHDYSRQLLVPFDYQCTVFFPKFWHIKRVAGYLFTECRFEFPVEDYWI